MEAAITLAVENARERWGGPFAALIARFPADDGRADWSGGALLSGGTNRVVPARDTTAHAEVVALRAAQQTLGWNLGPRPTGAVDVMIGSAQPCVQCWGALFWSSLDGVVYAASAKETQRHGGFDEGPIPRDWAKRLRAKGIRVERVPHRRRLEPFAEYRRSGGLIYNAQRQR